ARQEVHVALVVADRDRAAVRHRRRQAAEGQLVVLPGAGAGIAVEGEYRTLVVRDEHEALVDRHAHLGRDIVGPAGAAGGQVEAAYATLVGHGAHVVLDDDRVAADVGDALELGRA